MTHPRSLADGSAVARLHDGPHDGAIVDVSVRVYLPSMTVYVKAIEGTTVAIDNPHLLGDRDDLAELRADGWTRYLRIPDLTHRPGHPWPYVVWAAPDQ
jgi:hypothetical protein